MSGSEVWLRILLRALGVICPLAIIPLFMPVHWLDAGHRWMGLGPFPSAPTTEYLARSVSALSAFYGGLLLMLASDVRRFAPVIAYQAPAIMALPRWASSPGLVQVCRRFWWWQTLLGAGFF